MGVAGSEGRLMPARPSDPRSRRRPAREDVAHAARLAVARAFERRTGVVSIDTARRDRRARAAGTLDGVRALEDKLLDLAQRGERP